MFTWLGDSTRYSIKYWSITVLKWGLTHVYKRSGPSSAHLHLQLRLVCKLSFLACGIFSSDGPIHCAPPTKQCWIRQTHCPRGPRSGMEEIDMNRFRKQNPFALERKFFYTFDSHTTWGLSDRSAWLYLGCALADRGALRAGRWGGWGGTPGWVSITAVTSNNSLLSSLPLSGPEFLILW